MLVKYKKPGEKKYTWNGKEYIFYSSEFIGVDDILLFKRLQRYPDVFETVELFNLEPFERIAKHLRFKKNLIFATHPSAVRQLEKLPNVELQAVVKKRGQYVFRIVDHKEQLSDANNFKKINDVAAFVGRGQGGLGDIIMTSSAIEMIREKFSYHITYGCPERYVPLFNENPFVNRVVPWTKGNEMLASDFQVDLTTPCINYERQTAPNVELSRPEIFVKATGFDPKETPSPKLFLNAKEITTAKLRLNEYGLKIGIQVKASVAIRDWGHFKELRNKLLREYANQNPVIIEFHDEVPDGWVSNDRVLPIFRKDRLRQDLALIHACDVFIGPDSGLTHAAAALRVPTVWLFTHINAKCRIKNYRDAVALQGSDNCKFEKGACWYDIECVDANRNRKELFNVPCSETITVDQVYGEVKKVLDKPFVSWCVVFHSDPTMTKDCLTRIVEYAKYNDELLVLSNGVPTEQIEKFMPENIPTKIKRVAILREEKNIGCIKARNKLMKESSGRYILPLDNDQLISAATRHRLLSLDGDIVGTEAWAVQKNGNVKRVKMDQPFDYVGAGGMVIRADVAKKLKYFDEAFHPAYFEDPDLCFRAKEMGFKVNRHPNPGIEHLAHQTMKVQKDFDLQESWKESKKVFLNRWKAKVLRPRIAIMVDVRGWAWDYKATQIKKHLSDEFDITLIYPGNAPFDFVHNKTDFVLSFGIDYRLPDSIRKNGIPVISGITAHTIDLSKELRQEVIRNSIAVHANSMLLFEEMSKHHDNVYYVPNGVDESHFKYRARAYTKPFTVGYVGKPVPQKGLDKIIAPACKAAGVKLKAQVARYNSENKMTFEEMPGFYHDIDAIMIASTMDGTPNQLLEAASVGRTFIGNRIGNVFEFWNGRNGLMVDGLSVDEYVRALNLLKNNRKKCVDMGREARKKVKEGWAWKIQAENYREMFREVIEKI